MASQRMVTWLCVSVISLISLSLQQEGDWRLEVEPRYIQVRSGSPVTVTCTLSDGAGGRVPLAGCGFRHYGTGAAWNIGTGSATINNTIWRKKTSALITSNPEDAGRCRLQIEGLSDRPKYRQGDTYILGCRVRPVTGAWRYAAMMVYVSDDLPLQYRLQPPGVWVSLPGSVVNVTGLAERRVGYCSFYRPSTNSWTSFHAGGCDVPYKNTTENSAWYEGMFCGMTWLSDKPSSSGFVMSRTGDDFWSPSPHRSSADFVELLVAGAPDSPPQLTLDSEHFHAGDILSATCIVTNSTPVSNITWLLGGVAIREDRVNEGPAETAWRWSYEPQTIMQRLSHRLSDDDQGKVLTCRAKHLAYPKGFQDSNKHTIRFLDPCSPNPCGPNSACHVTGKYIRCSCLPRHTGSDPHCRPECVGNADCPEGKACVESVCEDVCPGDCGINALCRVISHASLCECPVGFSGDPHTRCEEEHGVKLVAGQLLISNGRRTTAAQVPWHAGIYGTSNGSYVQLCGGTLISTKVVVTAAHCFWDNQHSRKANNATGAYIVALGKYHRDWEVEDEEMQRMDIAGVFLHKRFRGLKRNYDYDVAVVQLANEAQITTTVQFALMDWHNTYDSIQLVEGRKGIVAGWGISENGTSSNALMSVELPYVDSDVCFDMLSSELQAFATHDKFCAGYTDRNTSVCPGDSGGGWVFRRLEEVNGRWKSFNYLRGVVSVGFTPAGHDKKKCYAQQVAGFSSLSDRATLQWIKKFPIDIILNNITAACGVKAAATSLVAGGRATDRGAWPWLAAIYENEDFSFVCGGSLINNKRVLTAAHCIKNNDVNKSYEKDQILVVLGKYQQSQHYERYNEPRNVEKLHIHDLYDTLHPSKFDIALLVLDDPVSYSIFVQPICLFTSDFTSNLLHQSGTVVGWGETENETITNVPREGGVRIVSQEECHSNFPLLSLFTNENTLCGGYRNGTGPCAGDSGGPLMVRANASDGVARWHLRGIVSSALGIDSCRNTEFAIYTDVVKLYTSWLKPLLTG